MIQHFPAIAFFTILAATSSSAAIVGFTFTGVTTTNQSTTSAINAEFPVGTRWTVRVEWDSTAPYTGLYPGQSTFALTKFTATFEGKGGTWTTSSLPGKASFSLNEYGGTHEVQFTSGWGATNHTNPTIKDLAPYSINVTLIDPTSTAIPSLEVTPTGVDLKKWSDSEFKIYLNEAASAVIYGSVDLATVVKTPDIGVKAPGGKQLHDGKSTTDFGTAKVGAKGEVVKYTIYNSGEGPLKWIKVAMSGPYRNDFKVTPPLKKILGKGESTTFKVTFNPTAKGTRNAEVRISSNDPNEKIFNIKVTGKGN